MFLKSMERNWTEGNDGISSDYFFDVMRQLGKVAQEGVVDLPGVMQHRAGWFQRVLSNVSLT